MRRRASSSPAAPARGSIRSRSAVSKQLLPVYDKPMIYYPLSTLMLAGIRDILIISTPHDQPRFQQLARRRQRSGASTLEYAVQPSPGRPRAGLHHRPRLHRRRPVALVLGDNIFYGHGLDRAAARRGRARPTARPFRLPGAATPSATAWSSSTRPGAWSASRKSRAQPKSQLRRDRPLFLRQPRRRHRGALKPSARGELEITDLNRAYLERGAAARRACWAAAWPGSTPARTSRCSRPRSFIADHREAAGPEDRLPRGDRLSHGLHRRRGSSSGSASRHGQERLRRNTCSACCASHGR